MAGKIEVKQVKSEIGFPKDQRETIKGLGLKKIHQTRVLEDTACVRGMINRVRHLVTFKEV